MTETPSPTDLTGKVAIVTGASRGIGRAIAVAYARAGASVALVARSEDALAETSELADPTGERVLPVVADLRDPESGATVVASTLEKFGRIDVLVNNAGVHYETPLLESSADDWFTILDVNLHSVVNLTRHVGRVLVVQGSGTVINVTSSWATKAIPKHSAYVTSKAALAHFTRSLAREWARHGVTVNALAPGYFATEITREGLDDPDARKHILGAIPQRRVAEPEEIGPLAVFLASAAASYVTGSSYSIDGGMEIS